MNERWCTYIDPRIACCRNELFEVVGNPVGWTSEVFASFEKRATWAIKDEDWNNCSHAEETQDFGDECGQCRISGVLFVVAGLIDPDAVRLCQSVKREEALNIYLMSIPTRRPRTFAVF